MSEAPRGRNFVHRANRDGTFDSICPRCFQTIANKTVESDLEQDENGHICPALVREPASEGRMKKDVHPVAGLPMREGFKAG